jgi:hypothetical protein
MQDETFLSLAMAAVTKPFNTLKNGNIQGSVCRILSNEPVPVFDTPAPKSPVMVRLKPGSLVVAFSDPGELRQINTADQQFGYISRSVKLVPVKDLEPESLYDPEKRAAAEAALPPLEGAAPAHAVAQIRQKRHNALFMAGFVVVILLGFLYVATRPAPDPELSKKPEVTKAKPTAADFVPPHQDKK